MQKEEADRRNARASASTGSEQPRSRRSSRRRRPRRPQHHRPQQSAKPKSRPDLIPVKDEEIDVDRIMRKLSRRASQLRREILGQSKSGIIDTTSQQTSAESDPIEAAAAALVRQAVPHKEVLEIMAQNDWNLAFDYKITSHRPKWVAFPLRLVKRIIRRFVRLYTDFLVIRQNRINFYLVNLCSRLVRELVRQREEFSHEVHKLRSQLDRQNERLSSSVAAINARFDNNEARIDLLRSEIDLRAQLARETLEPEDSRALSSEVDSPPPEENDTQDSKEQPST